MEADRIQNVVDDLSKFVPVSEEKKNQIILNYLDKSEIEFIKELSQVVYRNFRNDEETYNSLLSIIRSVDPENCPPIDQMKVMLDKMYSNVVEGNMSLEDNHKLINESIIKFTTLFNENNIDYYIVGALPCFIKTGIPLFRYHDDIDIMINENDIDKVSRIIKEAGYIFHDDRFPSVERNLEMMENKPPHTVLAQNPYNEFHLGFFTFRREQDYSITVREYSSRLENNDVKVDVMERHLDPIGTELNYNSEPIEYMGTVFRTSSVESVYQIKGFTNRPKDITDKDKLEPYIDKDKLEELRKHPFHNEEIKNISSDIGDTSRYM